MSGKKKQKKEPLNSWVGIRDEDGNISLYHPEPRTESDVRNLVEILNAGLHCDTFVHIGVVNSVKIEAGKTFDAELSGAGLTMHVTQVDYTQSNADFAKIEVTAVGYHQP